MQSIHSLKVKLNGSPYSSRYSASILFMFLCWMYAETEEKTIIDNNIIFISI